MNFLIAAILGSGVAGFAYSKMGRRLGYDNQQNVLVVVAVAFVLSTIVFYTILTTFINTR